MKSLKYKSRYLGFFVIFFLISEPSFAQADASVNQKYEKRIEKYKSAWNKLIPDHYKIQYAGSMGIASLGVGWAYGKNNQWETDFHLGIVPRYSTHRAKATITLKQNFMPWKTNIGKDFYVELFSCGLYINSILDGDFWTNEPDKYPNSYYSFSTKLRFNIYLGQRITYKIRPEKRTFAKALTFYYEISTSDLYIANAFTNSYLKPTDYLHLSLGLKMAIN